MKIKKNGKVIRLTESDLRRIAKRFLNENEDPKKIVIDCIMKNTSLDDVTNLPEACIKMITEKDVTKALECGMEMDYDDVKLIVSKIEPISKCVMGKMGKPGPMY
jgi:hypothetical protein